VGNSTLPPLGSFGSKASTTFLLTMSTVLYREIPRRTWTDSLCLPDLLPYEAPSPALTLFGVNGLSLYSMPSLGICMATALQAMGKCHSSVMVACKTHQVQCSATFNYETMSSLLGFKINNKGQFCYVPERIPEQGWYRNSMPVRIPLLS
jgi:hypothetical protein